MIGSGSKLSNIQHLRAFAALLVLVAHLGPMSELYAAKIGVEAAFPEVFGTFGVDVFFIISGFVMWITASKDFGQPGAAQRFMVRRLIRVVPIYWILTLVAAALLFYSRLDEPARQVTWQQLGQSLLFIPYISETGKIRPILGVGWTLQYEMLFYAVFALALFMRGKAGLLALIGTLGALVVIGALFDPPAPLLAWTMPILLEFLLGVGLAIVYQRNPAWAGSVKRVPSLVFASLLTLIYFAIPHAPEVLHDEMMFRPLDWLLALAIVAAALVTVQSREANPLTQFFGEMGEASYALYLIHPIVGELMIIAVAIAQRFVPISPVAFWIITFAACIVASVIFSRLVEVPIRRRMLQQTKAPQRTVALKEETR